MKPYTIDQLKEDLIKKGFTISSPRGPEKTGVDWYAWKQLASEMPLVTTPCCAHNNRAPTLVLSPWYLNNTYYSVSIEVRGQVPGPEDIWIQLHTYSLPMDTVILLLPKITHVLQSSWKAAWQGAKDYDDIQMLDRLAAWA